MDTLIGGGYAYPAVAIGLRTGYGAPGRISVGPRAAAPPVRGCRPRRGGEAVWRSRDSPPNPLRLFLRDFRPNASPCRIFFVATTGFDARQTSRPGSSRSRSRPTGAVRRPRIRLAPCWGPAGDVAAGVSGEHAPLDLGLVWRPGPPPPLGRGIPRYCGGVRLNGDQRRERLRAPPYPGSPEPAVDELPAAGYFDQSRDALFVRCAVLERILSTDVDNHLLSS